MCSVGTCSWSKVTTSQPLAKVAQRGEVGVVAVPDVGGDQRGAVVGDWREHAQRLAEGDRGLVGHPGQLAAAHHADNGQTGPGIHSAASLSEPGTRRAGTRAAAGRTGGPTA